MNMMPTQSKSFKVLFLAVCCLVILLSLLAVSSRAVPETSTVSHQSRAVSHTPSISHHIVSVGTTLTTYDEHRNAVSAIAWSPDQKELASASYDKTVQVWDPVTGQRFTTYRGHTNWVTAVAWSPNGKYLASASYDKSVQVWEAATGRRLGPRVARTGRMTKRARRLSWYPPLVSRHEDSRFAHCLSFWASAGTSDRTRGKVNGACTVGSRPVKRWCSVAPSA